MYVTLGATSIVTEEVAPILGGFAAFEGHLGLKRVMVACALGTWVAGVALYAFGWWRGPWLRGRGGTFGQHLRRALGAVGRRPWRAALLVRLAVGARIVLPIACGAAHIPLGPYLAGSAISSVVWSITFTLVGWAFGSTAVLVLGQVRRYEYAIGVAVVAIVVGIFLLLRWRERRVEDVDQEPGTGDQLGG